MKPNPIANMLPAGACAANPLLIVGAAEPVLVKFDIVVSDPVTPVPFVQLDLETEVFVPVTNLTAEHYQLSEEKREKSERVYLKELPIGCILNDLDQPGFIRKRVRQRQSRKTEIAQTSLVHNR